MHTYDSCLPLKQYHAQISRSRSRAHSHRFKGRYSIVYSEDGSETVSSAKGMVVTQSYH